MCHSANGNMLGNVTLSPRVMRDPSGKVGVTEKIFSRQNGQTGHFTGKGERLIDMPLEPLRTDPAPEAGQVFLTVL